MFEPAPRGLVLAALQGDRMLGFATGFAVDEAAYHGVVYVGDEGLPHHVSLSLFHAFATLVARRRTIRELMHGLEDRDDLGLLEFKRRIGLVVTQVPARVWLAPGVGPLLHYLHPQKHYRWVGSVEAASGPPGPVELSKPAP
jgi:hypothetical protein